MFILSVEYSRVGDPDLCVLYSLIWTSHKKTLDSYREPGAGLILYIHKIKTKTISLTKKSFPQTIEVESVNSFDCKKLSFSSYFVEFLEGFQLADPESGSG